MQIIPYKSKVIEEGDLLLESVLDAGIELEDGDILVVSSKVVSFCEERVLDFEGDIKEFVKLEAEKYVEGDVVDLTKKFGIWIANAGIDKSNVPKGKIILWPENPQKSADELWAGLKEKFSLNDLGVMVIDSVCQPGRQGVIGVCLAFRGFEGVSDERGSMDLFGNEIAITTVAKADSIASAANVVMGEGDQSIPFCVVKNAPVEFIDMPVDSIDLQSIDADKCIFSPLFIE